MKKRLSGIIAAVLLLTALSPGVARAAEAGRFLQGYQIRDTYLQILSANLAQGDYLLTLDGQELSVERSTVAEQAIPVTVYCLVDVSGSMKDEQMAQVRQTLQAISDAMGEDDNMVISALGNSVISSGLLGSAQERNDAIAALVQGHEDTNLYAGIVESLTLLQTDTTFHQKRCLIILSDGVDYQPTGITEQEATAAVLASHLPVYTVATLRQNPTQSQTEYAKLLGSFARSSVGGLHAAPVVDGIAAAEAGEAIWDSIQNSVVLNAGLDGLELNYNKTEALLRVVYTSGDIRMEDTLTIFTEDLPKPPAAPEPTQEPEPSPSQESEPSASPEPDEPDGESPWLLIAGIAAAVAAVVIILVLVLVLRKKKPPVEEPQPEPEAILPTEPVPETAPVTASIPEPGPPAGCTLVLTAIGHGDTICRAALPDRVPIIIGRDPSRANLVPDPQDSRMSGVHCQIMRDGRKLYVFDQTSTNGTFVNGVPIQGKGWMPIAAGEILRTGTRDYRVICEFTGEN